MLPLFMIASSLALVILWLVESDLALDAFYGLWILNGLSFVFLIVLTLLIDPAIARRTWRRAVMFPGLISVTIVLATCFPAVFRWIGDSVENAGWSFNHTGERIVLLALYLWVSLCMAAAYALVKLERAGAKRTAAVGLWFVGYGPVAVRHHADGVHQGSAWRRSGVGEDAEDRSGVGAMSFDFDEELETTKKIERRIFWKELAALCRRSPPDRGPPDSGCSDGASSSRREPRS